MAPIDLTSIIAVIMGISIVLVPVIGLTARFALKPVVEALSQTFERRDREETLKILERRIALLEAQVEGMEHAVSRLEETSSFDAQLKGAGPETGKELPGPPEGDRPGGTAGTRPGA
jgi:hypothetical protein